MITEQQVTNVDMGGIMAPPKDFTIKATAAFYKLLSSQVYTDKITACIRELCCNASDAHVASGKINVPFEVQLPTDLDKQFIVKDYGTGLSEDDIYNLYTSYGSSSKGNSNDFIGCMGIGSKAPFSYVNGFTVISHFNGRKMTFMAFLKDDSCPAVTKVSDVPYDGPNGLEVSFPVFEKDIYNFVHKFEKVMEFFDPKPVTNLEFDYKYTEYIIRTPKWGLRKGYSYDSKPRIIMGNVAYPIPREVGGEDFPPQLDLFTPIGTVEVAASREALSLTERSIKNLTLLLAEVKEEVFKETKAKIGQMEKVSDAIRYILSTKNDNILNEFNLENYYDTYPNFVLDENSGTFTHHEFSGITIYNDFYRNSKPSIYYQMTNETIAEELALWELKKKDNPTFHTGDLKLRKYKFIEAFKDEQTYVVDDLKSGLRFVKRFAKANYSRNVVFFTGDRTVINAFLKRMEIDKITLTSELKEQYPDAKKISGGTAGFKKLKINGGYSEFVSEYWTSSSEIEPLEDGSFFYVPILRFTIDGIPNNQRAIDIIQAAQVVFGERYTVYGLNAKQIEKIEGGINIFNYIKEKFKTLDSRVIDEAYKTGGLLAERGRIDFVKDMAKSNDVPIELRRLFAAISRCEVNESKNRDKFDKIKTLYLFVNDHGQDLVDTSAELIRRFPLLKKMDNGWYLDKKDHLHYKEYVLLKEKHGNKELIKSDNESEETNEE